MTSTRHDLEHWFCLSCLLCSWMESPVKSLTFVFIVHSSFILSVDLIRLTVVGWRAVWQLVVIWQLLLLFFFSFVFLNFLNTKLIIVIYAAVIATQKLKVRIRVQKQKWREQSKHRIQSGTIEFAVREEKRKLIFFNNFSTHRLTISKQKKRNATQVKIVSTNSLFNC